MAKKAKKKYIRVQVVIKNEIAKEDMPYPYVHYPDMYGAFIGFSEKREEMPRFCSCQRIAIQNYLRISPLKNSNYFNDKEGRVRGTRFSKNDFPLKIAELSVADTIKVIGDLKFSEGICHVCLKKVPSFKYCAPMYGGEFKQSYGWYVNQMCYEAGTDNYFEHYLEDIVPDILLEEFERRDLCRKRYDELVESLPRENLIPFFNPRMVRCMKGISEDKKQEIFELEKGRSINQKLIHELTENRVRLKLGVKPVGKAWVKETLLFNIITGLLQGKEVIHHYRANWLEGLELDIYVPELKLGVEYQGEQHYRAFTHWGGEEAFQRTQERDKKKKKLCRKEKVDLVYFNFKEAISEQLVTEKLSKWLKVELNEKNKKKKN